MKALLIDREASHPLLLPPQLTLIADSSITPPGRPVFLPDFTDDWAVEFYFAVKVSRLGKDIALKFAPRYFENFTLAMRIVPIDIVDALRSAGRPDGVASVFDNALTLGEWTPFPASEEDTPLTITLNDAQIVIEQPRLCAAQAIEAISRYCTLKTGDILMPFRLTPPATATSGATFTATLLPTSTPLLTQRLH